MQTDHDIAYIHTAFPQLSPTHLRGLFASLGRPFPVEEGLRICEVGCGTGLSAAITAASHPSANILAVDALPLHVEKARALARSADLPNLEVVEADIRDFDPGEEGFDLILCHGVLSWVSEEVRSSIVRFSGQNLRPGGVAYLHYATHPGASALAIVHKALALTRQPALSAIRNVREGLNLIAEMRRGAGLFTAHPGVANSLDRLQGEPDGFLAHELGGQHWTPLHVGDVVGAMQSLGCHYAGSAMLAQNVDAFSLPASCLPTVRAAGSVAIAETLKDIARDESMRQDLYQKGAGPLSSADHLAALRAQTYVASPNMPAKGPLTFQMRVGPVEASAAVIDPVLRRLAEGPASFGELEAFGAFRTGPALLNQTLSLLMTAGLVHVRSQEATDERAREGCRRLNAVLARMQDEGEAIPAFACAERGGPIASSIKRPR